MTNNDVMRDVVKHVRRVATLLMEVVSEIQTRAINHDESKFSEEEFSYFVAETPKLRHLTYNSPEYYESMSRLAPALEHHYKNNDHHPEFFGTNGVEQMDLIQLIEMLADWRAATERHDNGNLARSIHENAKRFEYSLHTKCVLAKTALRMKWITEEGYKAILTTPHKFD